eukprot:TRINITY_DN15939_c1_g2_i1.p1 TRINITY_DN15939_c1_g2~~TRINITY_DN15939_c1_g2_i1.p1  ORF type:complete len:373 (+),score=60.80 TRINITY_DN15939_c1_g2_i1:84-1202(+)
MDANTTEQERSTENSQSLKAILAKFGRIRAGTSQVSEEDAEGEEQLPRDGFPSASRGSNFLQPSSRSQMRASRGGSTSVATQFPADSNPPPSSLGATSSSGMIMQASRVGSSDWAGSGYNSQFHADSNQASSFFHGSNCPDMMMRASWHGSTTTAGFGGKLQFPADSRHGSKSETGFGGSARVASSEAAQASRGYENSRVHRWKSQVVLCHGQCFKALNNEKRNALKRVANMHMADLACIRRPDKLIALCRSDLWLSETLKFWVALTVWREAKSLFDLCKMSTVTPMMPRFMIVTCGGESQYRKAVQWAGDVRPPFPIYCVREADESVEGSPQNQMLGHFEELSELLRLAEQEGLPSQSEFHSQNSRTIIML